MQRNLFLLFTLLATAVQAAKVELPFTLCGQSVYRSDKHTTMTVGTERVNVYELVGVADSGAVYYLPEKQALLLENVVIDYRQKAFVIQSLQDIRLTVMVRGENHITSIGTVIYSTGGLTVYGEGTDLSTLHIHGVGKKGYNNPEYGFFSGRDMTLSNLTFHAEGFCYTFYGIQAFGDEKTTLWLENVTGDLMAQGYEPCVVRGFNNMQMLQCSPSKEQHGDHSIRYYGIHLEEDGKDCRELHLTVGGLQQPATPDHVVESPVRQDTDSIYTNVDEAPQFPGGNAALQKYFQENLFKKEGTPSVEEAPIVEVVEESAHYGENSQSLMKYISENMHYPAFAEEQGIQGRVLVRFVVETDGTISNFEVLRSPDSSLEKEARRLIESAPDNWHPAIQHGKPVRSQLTIPIMFRLTKK